MKDLTEVFREALHKEGVLGKENYEWNLEPFHYGEAITGNMTKQETRAADFVRLYFQCGGEPMNDRQRHCTKCDKLLEDEVVYLNFDKRTKKYTDERIPPEFCEGRFTFDPICAKEPNPNDDNA